MVVTGYSAGSIATQELMKYDKDLLAGAMPGAFPNIFPTEGCALSRVAAWVFGNDSDDIFQASKWRVVDGTIMGCPGVQREFTLTVNSNDCQHGCWDQHWARADVQQWLVQQVQ